MSAIVALTMKSNLGFKNVEDAGVYLDGKDGSYTITVFVNSQYRGDGTVISKPQGSNLCEVAVGKFRYDTWGVITAQTNSVTMTADEDGNFYIDFYVNTVKVAHFDAKKQFGTFFDLNPTVVANTTWTALVESVTK